MTDKTESSNFLTLKQIIAADDINYRDVEVPEWGGTVRLGAMAASERDRYESQVYLARQKGGDDAAFDNVRARLVAACMINPKVDRKQIAALGNKNAKTINRLFDICRELNGISEQDAEDLEKN